MEKTHFCRICRTENNLKYTTKELRQLNKKRLLLAQATQQGQAENRASKKLLLTTPTLGNICQVCDERIQIFHRLDDGENESSSDVEIEVVSNINESLPIRFVDTLQNGDILKKAQRPETPVIVDDDDMLFNIFMQKFNQKTEVQRPQINSSFSQPQLEKNQFHTTYTPPQSTGGGSEGDESKVTEVLTSRESTPAPNQSMPPLTSGPKMVDPQGHRIVAIIELDDIDDNEPKNCDQVQSGLCTPVVRCLNDLSCIENNEHRSVLFSPNKTSNTSTSMHDNFQTVTVEDDEEIVFRKVDSEQEGTPALKKRKRKSYDEKELRLVASLSLVSSDSETEETPLKVQVTKTPSTVVAEASTLTLKKSFSCNVCRLIFPDFESLSVHERIHQGVKCTLCQVGFQQIKRLIHHMRRKHREYNGDALLEKPRSSQDSCMTIRLRYMQHTTFYECQLCGRIDDVFREHKEHIIEKHPNESKSLKDPIMKQIKCPVCKAKCGVQYLSLCRHLLSSHEYQEYKNHLRELVHVSAFGWNAARQQEVAKTAKIFQFVKRKTFFFECKECHKVVAGYLHHLRHVNEHQQSVNDETKAKTTAFKKILSIKASSNVGSVNTSTLGKLCNSLKKDEVSLSMKLRKKDNISKKLTGHINLNNKTKQAKNIINITNKVQKSTKNGVQSKLKTNHIAKVKKPNKTLKSEKSEAGVKKKSMKKIEIKNKLKPKEKEIEKLPNSAKLTKGKAKKETSKNDNKLKEKSTKVKDIELRPQVIKIKVKAPIRQIDLQKYKCKYCLKQFKGFRLYNLHLLRQHKEHEYSKCNKCNKFYIKFPNFEKHITQCFQVLSTSKQKRKFSERVSLSEKLNEISETCVTKVPNKSDANSYLEDNYLWLKDLLKLKESLEIRDSSLTFQESSKTALLTQNPIISQCCYCLHLFANDNDLMEHKKRNHLQNPDILIKYKPFKNPQMNK